MDCLDGYIGLQGCQTDEPESGLYVNSLPGISLEITEKIADSEQRNFNGVWADVVTRVKTRFEMDVKVAMKNKRKVVVDDDCSLTDLICDNLDRFKHALWYLHGVEILAERIYTSRLNRFTTIDKKIAKELRDEFMMEYQTSLNMAVESWDCGECLECDDIMRFEQASI